MAELADAQDLKSCGERSPYRFDSGPRHHLNKAPVAQLDRAFDYGSRGYGFDSYRARHFIMIINYIREVAQLGRALGLGPRGRRFESCLPDFFLKLWGLSSAGRAPALHAGGQRFDPASLHHNNLYIEN